jgi:hypothetical protein
MAFCTNRNELRFLSSVRVPSSVASEAPLLEIAVVHPHEHQDVPEGSHVGRRLGARADVRLAHDLDERRARAVQIDERIAAHAVHVLARILLHVDPLDPDMAALPVHRDIQVPVLAERRLVLRDLIALRQIRVEVLLAGKDAPLDDSAAGRKRRTHGKLHRPRVGDGQRARQPEAHRTHVCVRCRAERRRAPAEQLALSEQLRVDLETDDRFVLHLRLGVFLPPLSRGGAQPPLRKRKGPSRTSGARH